MTHPDSVYVLMTRDFQFPVLPFLPALGCYMQLSPLLSIRCLNLNSFTSKLCWHLQTCFSSRCPHINDGAIQTIILDSDSDCMEISRYRHTPIRIREWWHCYRAFSDGWGEKDPGVSELLLNLTFNAIGESECELLPCTWRGSLR